MKWISVEDRLPDCWVQHGDVFTSELVLTYDVYNETEIGERVEIGEHTEKGFEITERAWTCDVEVTHWMPLPESPITHDLDN